MTVLVTGSSGWLGRHLVQMLRKRGDAVVGLDPAPSEWTSIIGSVADRALVDRIFGERDVAGVIHAGALHKPDIARYPSRAFVDINVTGTLNLLDAAARAGAPFVFTSTTSLMIDRSLRDERGETATWLDETHGPLAPRNIYGVTKLCAEGLCRQHHQTMGLSCIVLRTARFFPEEDDTHRAISGPNMKVNELLNRRASVEDMTRAHLLALERAATVGFGLYIVSAPTRLTRRDGVALKRDAGFVIRRHYPRAAHLYAKLGWRMPDTLGRVYDGSRITRELGFQYETRFETALYEAALRDRSLLRHDPAYVSPLAAMMEPG
ncbi:MAG: NAD(P)-dependent oxidoreductase [Litorimonas sp.]